MDYIQEWKQSLNQQRNIQGLVNDGIFSLESKILALQRQQISQHEGFDNAPLHSTSNNGVYKKETQHWATAGNPYPSLTRKPEGGLYNFVWGGDFMNNFRLKRQSKGFSIYSTGTGSGEKKDFFEGYTNMFGLDTENTATVMSEVEYYVLEKRLSKVYG